MEQQASISDTVEVDVVKAPVMSQLEQAIYHSARSFGDAVDKMVSDVLTKNDITPMADKKLELFVQPPEGGTAGWTFTVIYDSTPVGSFEVGVYASLN